LQDMGRHPIFRRRLDVSTFRAGFPNDCDGMTAGASVFATPSPSLRA
jgi:hypothetical protein